MRDIGLWFRRCHVGRPLQRLDPQDQRLQQYQHSPYKGNTTQPPIVNAAESLVFLKDGAVGAAHCQPKVVHPPDHHAFNYGLSAVAMCGLMGQ